MPPDCNYRDTVRASWIAADGEAVALLNNLREKFNFLGFVKCSTPASIGVEEVGAVGSLSVQGIGIR